jgi:hypothetical protein
MPTSLIHHKHAGQALREQITGEPLRNSHTLRRQKLQHLIDESYQHDRGKFLRAAHITKGRLSQLLDPRFPFGDAAARNLETRLALAPGYFDALDARTLEFALMFESLPEQQKARWETLLYLLASK